MAVKDFMTRAVITISPETTIAEAVRILRKQKVKGLPVINENGKVCGMFTLKNLLFIIEEKIDLQMPVKIVMQPNVTFIEEDSLIEDTCMYPRKRLPVLDREGDLVGMLTKSDIIRGFKAQSTRATEQLKAVLESTPNGIISIDRNHRVVFINSEARNMLKIEADKEVEGWIDEIIPESILVQDEVLVHGKKIRNRKRTHNGQTYVVNAAPIFEGNEIVGAVASLQLISEFEFMANELNLVKRLNRELDVIIGSSYDGMFVTDGEGTLQQLNAACGKLLGMDPERVLSRNAIEVAQEHKLGDIVVKKVLETKKVYSTSYKLNGKTLAVTGSPVLDENGKIIKIISNVRDLTELSCLREKLEQVNRLKDKYLSELSQLRTQVASESEMFRSEEMQRVYDLAIRVAVVDAPILIQGESGVGKEVLASFIHQNSLRRDHPFIKINCAAIPETLLESELFGYAEGAFTGAKKGGKPGLFEVANGGTLFLDEIGEMPALTQAKLLRVLQDQEVTMVGSVKPIKFNVRLLFATNRNLETEVSAKRFREDLYFRINVVPIQIPPLRERPADITILTLALLQKMNEKHHMEKRLSNAALELFTQYSWPGNVRELINVIERLVIVCNSDLLLPEDLPHNFQLASRPLLTFSGVPEERSDLPLKCLMDKIEKEIIEKTLKECKSLRKTARSLGVDPATLLRKLKKHSLKTLH